jgi:hypothetical protein
MVVDAPVVFDSARDEPGVSQVAKVLRHWLADAGFVDERTDRLGLLAEQVDHATSVRRSANALNTLRSLAAIDSGRDRTLSPLRSYRLAAGGLAPLAEQREAR